MTWWHLTQTCTMADELVAMGDDAEELQPEDRELKDKTRKWLEERAEGHWHAEVCHRYRDLPVS